MPAVADGPPLCANCGLDIPWPPVVVAGRAYCCGGCSQGGPCYCSYDRPAAPGETWSMPVLEEVADAALHPPGAAPGQWRAP